MRHTVPHSPFSTRLSGSAKETELRLRNIFQWKKKRPPALLFLLTALLVLFCCGLVSCQTQNKDAPTDNSVEFIRTSKILSETYDFDHNGTAELTELVTVSSSDGTSTHTEWFELQIKTADGNILWSEEAHPQHVGWNSLFACVMDGEDFLLRYRPSMFQGMCTYSYQLFSLNSNGEEILHQENSVDFDTNLGSPTFTGFDSSAVADFMDEINSLLPGDSLLLSTDDELSSMKTRLSQHTPSWLTSDYSHWGFAYDANKSMRENLQAFEAASMAAAGEQPTFKVSVNTIALVHYDPMGNLTQAQKNLLADLPATELPRQNVDLNNLRRSQIWQNTLIPFFYDKEYDVTFYGVVSAESSFLLNESYYELITDGIVLRVGNRAVYTPIPWYDNARWSYNPWAEIQDFDNDGKPEAALCTHFGHGTGVSEEALVIFDLDTLTYTVPDFTTLDIDVRYDPSAHTATLSAGEHIVTVPLDSHLEPLEEVTSAHIIDFYFENGQLFFHTGLDFSGRTTSYMAQATAPVIWNGSSYCLGTVFSLTTY